MTYSVPDSGGAVSVSRQVTEVDALLQRLIDRIRPEKVVLHGSYAEGTARADSDIDLLVIVESDLRRDHRQEAISQALRPRRVPVDILAYSRRRSADAWSRPNPLFATY